MNLKEYIKSLVREVIEEENVTGGGEAYSTPFAFAPKGQKANAATKTAEKQGFKKAPGMPTSSKVMDYKEMWKGKKSAMNENNIIDKFKKWARNIDVGSKDIDYYAKKNNLTADQKSILKKAFPSDDIKIKAAGPIPNIRFKSTMSEQLLKIIKEELLKEVTYNKFKTEVKYRTKSEQLHKAIREVKRKLSEIDRIVEYTSRMKQELSEGEEGIKYWKATQKNVGQISEMVNQLNNKIKNLHQ